MTSVTLTTVRNAHRRDPSFSSYLGNSEETRVLKHGEPTWMASAAIIAPRMHAYQENLRRKKNGYGETSVFGAERYFNGLIHESAAIPVGKIDEKVGIRDMQQETRRSNPSNFSKTRWSSKRGLFQITQSRQNKPRGKSFLAKLRCNCYCFDKKSVGVEENILDKTCIKHKKNTGIHKKVTAKLSNEIKHDPVGLAQIKRTPLACWTKERIPCNKLKKGSDEIDSEDCFSLHIPNPGVGNLSLETKIEEVEEANARESLEVHGSPTMNKEEIPSSLEKKLAMLNWDANPTIESIAPFMSSEDNDIDSDSSSDLFELKGLSDSGHPFFRHRPSDGMSGCMSLSSGYDPSEASINWSVTTSSAANFSVATDFDEAIPKETVESSNSVKTMENTVNRTSAAKTGISKAKHCPSVLLHCKSHKAAKVAEGARRLPERKPEFRDITSQNLLEHGPGFKKKIG